MPGTNYRNTKGNSNRGGRNNSTGHVSHQQHVSNGLLESNDIDALLSQRPSFAQLDINNTPRHPHFGLGYKPYSTTPAAYPSTASTYPMVTKRFVKASQNLAATDPSLQQQDSNGSSLNPESSEKNIGSTTTDSDIITTMNNNDNGTPAGLTGTDNTNTNTNNQQQQSHTIKTQNSTSSSNAYVQPKTTNNSVTTSNGAQPNGTATDQNCTANAGQQRDWTAEQPADDLQRYGNQHDMYNYGRPYSYEYDDGDDDDDNGSTNGIQQDGVDEDVIDFGLCDSDDDEYIQAFMAYQQHDYQMMMAHYNPGIYGQPQYNNQHYLPNSHQQQKPKYRWYEDTPSGHLRRVDRRVQLFISDPSREKYQLPGMSTYCRRQVQGLATMYKLKMSHEDLGNNKIGPLLKKSPKTHLPTDRRAIEKHISKIRTAEKAKKQMERRPGGAASELLNRTRKEERRRLKGLPISDLAPTIPSVKKKSIPRVVGSEAAPLASNNIGHRMMASMGWKEGDSLGVNNDGIANPIQPVIRTNRRGLGA